MPGGGQQAGRPEAARPGGYLCSIFTGMCFSPVDCFFRGACSCRGPCPAFTNPSTASSEAPAPAGLVKYLVHEGNRRSSRFAQTAVEAVSASDCSSVGGSTPLRPLHPSVLLLPTPRQWQHPTQQMNAIANRTKRLRQQSFLHWWRKSLINILIL